MTTDLQANVVTVVPRRDVALPFHSLPDAIAAAGFTPGRMWLEARGRFVTGADGSLGFLIHGWPSAVGVSDDDVKGDTITAEVLADGSLRLE